MPTPRLAPRIRELLEVRPSGVHGLGAFAACDLPAGTKLGTYQGQRFTAEEAAQMDWDSTLTYLFSLSDGSLIDGGQGGNATRHLNHACNPNCEAIELRSRRGVLSLTLRTLRPVQAGEELFIDYALVIDPSESATAYPCRCQSTACRGTMVGATATATAT